MKLCKKKLSTIVNCDVLKLVSITFGKMLFVFIISSLFLPHLYKEKQAYDMSVCQFPPSLQSFQPVVQTCHFVFVPSDLLVLVSLIFLAMKISSV